jgi:hypothetical protein
MAATLTVAAFAGGAVSAAATEQKDNPRSAVIHVLAMMVRLILRDRMFQSADLIPINSSNRCKSSSP